MNQKENPGNFQGNENANLPGNTSSEQENRNAPEHMGGDKNTDNPIITAIIESSYGYGTGTPIKLEGEMTDSQGNRVFIRLKGDISLDHTDTEYTETGHYDPYGRGLHVKLTGGRIKFKR